MNELFKKFPLACTNIGREFELMVMLRSLLKCTAHWPSHKTAAEQTKLPWSVWSKRKSRKFWTAAAKDYSIKLWTPLNVKDRMQKNVSSIQCHNCKRPGHNKKDCNEKTKRGKLGRSKATPKSTSQEIAFINANSVQERTLVHQGILVWTGISSWNW